MNRSRRVALAALCVLALALGAATLNDTTAPPGGGGTPGVSGGDVSERPSIELPDSNSSRGGSRPGGFGSVCIEFLTTSTFYALVFILLLGIGAVFYRRGGLLLVVAGLGVIGPPGFLIWAILSVCRPPDLDGPGTGSARNNTGGEGGLFGGDSGGALPQAGTPELSQAILVIAAVVVLFLVMLMLRATDDDDTAAESEPVDEDVPPADLAGLAGIAGAAADRIESGGGETENEVYRAWREMTDYLDVPNPRSSTPAEFRAAARDAGLAAAHVDALTDLFRDVRYGGASVTADREAAAVDALRAIEQTHGAQDGRTERGDDES